MNNKDLNNLRHSCAHLLAAAILEYYPNAKLTLGPAVEDGFYYDIDFADIKISETDFSKIEQKMHELVKKWALFEKEELTVEEAKKRFRGNQYKIELIDEISKKGEKITVYKSGNFSDLCRGGHISHPQGDLKHFKLLSIAGAYWHGDEKNKMLTRIYGTCFPTQKELDDYLKMIEEAKKRDHRKIGKDLDLFVFSDLIGKGLPMLTAKGATIKRVLERFIVDEEIKRGYQHVSTPSLAKIDLYKTSGHYPYYKNTMYPVMKVDDEELILRPMTCPHHFMLYKSRPHSYHELPVKIAEISPQFRYEKSGELTGLIRIRMFMLADAHIIAEKNQAKSEISKVLSLISYVNQVLGLKKGIDYRYRLSLGERSDTKKYFKDDASWDNAESVLRDVLKNQEVPFYEAKNEAAFYGPKIDVQMKNVNGKEDTAFTVQYDFVMPKRFNLTFINKEGKEDEPIVIHRASLGCFERTMALLIEKYAGAFPIWLAPIQIAILPISEKQKDYSKKILKELLENGIRAEINLDSKPLGAKIREATLQKIPYLIIIGQKEVDSDKISIRERNGKDLGTINIIEFITKLKTQIENFS